MKKQSKTKGKRKSAVKTVRPAEVKKAEPGRPTKLNAETQQKVCDAILVGATYEAAAEYAGITYQTFLNWMKQGQADAEGIYFEFFGTVTHANAEAQVGFARNIKDAASNGDWRAASWILERRYPKAYGLRVGAIDDKDLDDAIESELARLAAARQTASAGEATNDTGDHRITSA